MGQVFYRDWQPNSFQDPTYNPSGANPPLESWQPTPIVNLPRQPIEWYDNRLTWPGFYLANLQAGGYTLDELYPYPVADLAYRFAPAEPIRRDVFNMLYARRRGANVSGEAPIQNVYTGVHDEGF